jgi:hypothetical protein
MKTRLLKGKEWGECLWGDFLYGDQERDLGIGRVKILRESRK